MEGLVLVRERVGVNIPKRRDLGVGVFHFGDLWIKNTIC